MKFNLKKVVAAATLAAAGSSSFAAVTFLSGSADLVYNPDLFGVLATISAVPSAVNSSTQTPSPLTVDIDLGLVDASGTPVSTATVSNPISSISVNAANQLTGGLSTSAGVKIARGSRSVVLSNFVIDQATATLRADVTAYNGAVVNPTYTQTNVFLAQAPATAPIGFTVLANGNYSYSYTIPTLTLQGDHAAGANTATGALGLFTGGLGVTSASAIEAADQISLGSLTINVLAQPVPEPSTYALMGLGLAGAAFVARRRAAKA